MTQGSSRGTAHIKKASLKDRLLGFVLGLVVVALFMVFGLSAIMVSHYKDQVAISVDDARLAEVDFDYIVVLGAGVRPDGSLSDMLKDRMNTGFRAYQAGLAPQIIVSGDHRPDHNDETTAMRNWLIDQGMPSERILVDEHGYNTFATCVNARDDFGAKRILLVSQPYHLPRALFIADKIGLRARGLGAPGEDYPGQWYRDLREHLARAKEFVKIKLAPEAQQQGDAHE